MDKYPFAIKSFMSQRLFIFYLAKEMLRYVSSGIVLQSSTSQPTVISLLLKMQGKELISLLFSRLQYTISI
jgi:hypothetical protein